ncbi:MAG: hypothetical protein ACFFDW_02700 [Candidatus Thorarchaeota archaeon]
MKLKEKALAIVILCNIVFLIPPIYPSDGRIIETIPIQITNSSTLIIDNFGNFTLDTDSEYINSSNIDTQLNFSYNKANSQYPLLESYLLDLNAYGNCSDFDIQFKLNYSYIDTQTLGSFIFNLLSLYNETGNIIGENNLGFMELWDPSVTEYGKFAVAGYPNQTANLQQTASNTAGAYGSIIFHANRSYNVLNLTITTLIGNQLITYNWSSGVSRALNLITLNFRSGNLESNVNVTCTDFYGKFIVTQNTLPEPPENILYMNNFNNFTLQEDILAIDSSNLGSLLNFSYHQGTSTYPVSEIYNYTLSNNRNASDFSIEVEVDYAYNEMNDQASFAVELLSNYDNFGNYTTTSIGYLEIWDEWISNYGRYHLVGYPNHEYKSYSTATGSLNQMGSVIFRAERIDGLLNLTILDSGTEEVIINQYWVTGVTRPLNQIRLIFTSGTTTHDFEVELTNLNAWFFMTNYTKPSLVSILDFNHFQILHDSEFIESLNNNTAINMNYLGTTTGNAIKEFYFLPLDYYGNCTDFDVTILLTYNYTGSNILGDFSIIYGSYYNESGYYSGLPSDEESKNILVQTVKSGVSGIQLMNIGYPFDEEQIESYISYPAPSTRTIEFNIEREENTIICTIGYDGYTRKINEWNVGVSKPLNYIALGGVIYPDSSEFVNATFKQIYGTLSFDIYRIVETNPNLIQNDANTGGDAGNTFETATLITQGNFQGRLQNNDVDDYYRFSIQNLNNIVISCSLTGPTDADFDLYLYDPYGNERDYSAGYTSSEEVTYQAIYIGYWRLRIFAYFGEGDYSFTLTIASTTSPSPDEQNDADSGGDAGDTFASATLISSGTYYGTFSEGDDFDFYQLPIGKDYEISITLDYVYIIDFDLVLYDPSYNEMDSSKRFSAPDTIYFTISESGLWRILVERESGYGGYTLEIVINEPSANENIAKIIGIIVGAIITLVLLIVVINNSIKKRRSRNQDFSVSYPVTSERSDESLFFRENREQQAQVVTKEYLSDSAISQHEKELLDSIYSGYSFSLISEKKEKKNEDESEDNEISDEDSKKSE